MIRFTHPHRQSRLAACVLVAITVACSPTQPAPTPPPDDLLIVAITGDDGDVHPIARYADGVWDRPPWATPFGLERLAAVPTGDSTNWRWPDGRRMWIVPGRASDTIGYSPRAVAVNVPDLWHLYSDSLPTLRLGTTGLHLVPERPCGFGWAVRTQDGRAGMFPHLGDFRTTGVSLSRQPSAVLTADELPDVGRIVEDLALQDEESSLRYDPHFVWLGGFRFDDLTIGVLHRLGYGLGLEHAVIELHGDLPRVVAEVRSDEC